MKILAIYLTVIPLLVFNGCSKVKPKPTECIAVPCVPFQVIEIPDISDTNYTSRTINFDKNDTHTTMLNNDVEYLAVKAYYYKRECLKKDNYIRMLKTQIDAISKPLK